MTDFGSISQTEGRGDVGNKNMRRPKLDLSFASFGYPISQQHRVSPTYSDGSDPLISHLMMGSRSNTPDDSDMSNSPETVADLVVSNLFIDFYFISNRMHFFFFFRIITISIRMVRLL